MDLRSRLIKRIHEEEVRLFASMAQSSFDDREFGEFFQLLYDEEARVAENVAWIMSHFNKAGRERLNSRKQLIMAEAMRTSNATKLRLLLAIILRQPFSEEEIATPFLDFCFDNITSSAQPIAIKSLSIYLSFFPAMQVLPRAFARVGSDIAFLRWYAFVARTEECTDKSIAGNSKNKKRHRPQ